MNIYITRDKTTDGRDVEAKIGILLTDPRVNFDPDLFIVWLQRPKRLTNLNGVDIGYVGRKQKDGTLDEELLVACLDGLKGLITFKGDTLEPGDMGIIESGEIKLKSLRKVKT